MSKSESLDITAITDIGLSTGKPITRKFNNFADANTYAKIDSKSYGKCVLAIDAPKLPNPFIYTYYNGELRHVAGL